MASPRETVISKWHANVDAIRTGQLAHESVLIARNNLSVEALDYYLRRVGRTCIIRAGDAAGYLVVAVEQKLAATAECNVQEWGNVPVEHRSRC